ncbi:sterol desaturase family protein [Reichenbachiella versicolor]|uniref:sterol desaturase family protein n=1 Tax=Reichenbachiella versicolor TaxID=1821036 RepID=UPI000D6DF56D|nr:sterol desaturase family protein [Reichenbachiella versicolor]
MKTQFKAQNTGQGTIFKNPVLEKLTKTHIAAPITAFTLVSSYVVFKGFTQYNLVVWQIAALFLAGLFLFTFVEYIMHRFLFHMDESTDLRKKVVYTMHGVHHDHPRDKDRLAMPVPLSLTLAFLFFLLYRLILGDLVYGFLPGFLMGYASYLGVHYMVHAVQPPKKGFWKYLWIHHGIHHYKQQERAFGVTTTIWDRIFGTMPK